MEQYVKEIGQDPGSTPNDIKRAGVDPNEATKEDTTE